MKLYAIYGSQCVLRSLRFRDYNPLHILLLKCAYPLARIAVEESYRRSTTNILPKPMSLDTFIRISPRPINGRGFIGLL